MLLEDLNSDPKFYTFLKKIQRDCSDFLEYEIPLFRGFKHMTGEYGEKSIRMDRKPRDASINEMVFANLLFEYYYGTTHIRNISTFAANQSALAMEYGKLAYVFPVNGSMLATYATKDSLNDIGHLYLRFLSVITDMYRKDNPDKSMKAVNIFEETIRVKFRRNPMMTLKDIDSVFNEEEQGYVHRAFEHAYFTEAVGETKFDEYKIGSVSNMKGKFDLWSAEILIFGKPKYYFISVKTAKEYIDRELPEFADPIHPINRGKLFHKIIRDLD